MTFMQVIARLAFTVGMWGAMWIGFGFASHLLLNRDTSEGDGGMSIFIGFVFSCIVSCFILAMLFWGFKK